MNDQTHTKTFRRTRLLDLHPIAVETFQRFDLAVERDPQLHNFRAFATHRSPEAQRQAEKDGSSKVGPWRSVHQYGCAADYAVWNQQQQLWSWDASSDAWLRLHAIAHGYGLRAPIQWDKGHLVLNNWRAKLTRWLNESRFT